MGEKSDAVRRYDTSPRGVQRANQQSRFRQLRCMAIVVCSLFVVAMVAMLLLEVTKESRREQ